MPDTHTIELDWRRLAQACGCLDIACLTPQSLPDHYLKNALTHWQNQGNLGALDYMDSRAEILIHPFAARPWARSAIILSFAPQSDDSSPLLQLPQPTRHRPAAFIASYALNQDYHITGQAILQRLKAELISSFPAPSEPQFDLCVDTKPVMEKELAVLAHLGEKGYHSLLRNRTHGAQLHLAVAFTSLPLRAFIPPLAPLSPCGLCRKCLAICPNRAFAPGERFQVRRCRAWLSGEYRQPLSREQQRLLGDTLFGCGLCSSACPALVQPTAPLAVDPLEVFNLPTGQLRRLIHNTALEHAGTTLLKRNAIANLANLLPAEQWRELARKLMDQTNSENLKRSIANSLENS